AAVVDAHAGDGERRLGAGSALATGHGGPRSVERRGALPMPGGLGIGRGDGGEGGVVAVGDLGVGRMLGDLRRKPDAQLGRLAGGGAGLVGEHRAVLVAVVARRNVADLDRRTGRLLGRAGTGPGALVLGG